MIRLAAHRVAAALLALLSATSPAPASSVEEREVGLVYVEANVGGASGGHAGLRIGDLAYHYQFVDGLLLLHRDPWEEFAFRYGTLENRPIHVAAVGVHARDQRRLHDHLVREHLAQRGRLERLETTAEGVEVLEALQGLRAGISVRGAGLLAPPLSPRDASLRDGAGAPRRGAPRRGAPGRGAPDVRGANLELRARIDEALGPGFLEQELSRADAELAAIGPRLAPDPARGTAEDLLRIRELLTLRAALSALRQGFDVDPSALLPLRDLQPLAPHEREALEGLRERLDRAVLELLTSGRPDRGHALLVATARRLTVERSLHEGRLRMLDPYPERPASMGSEEVARRRVEVVAVAGYAFAAYRLARELLLVPARINEPAWNRIEELGGRVEEYARGAESGRAIRELAGRLVPERRRELPLPARVLPEQPLQQALAYERLQQALARERLRAEEIRAGMRTLHPYSLTEENCVTEIVRALRDSLGGAEGMREVLGGELVAGERLGFIPQVFFAQALDQLAVRRVSRVTPYRERELASRYARESAGRVYLRESNALTTTVYERRDRDGSFLLFTDDVFWPRPLYGAFNLAFALGDGLLGTATAPFDRGRRIERAAKGAFFSLPELAFFNIRKGSFDAASLAHALPGGQAAGWQPPPPPTP